METAVSKIEGKSVCSGENACCHAVFFVIKCDWKTRGAMPAAMSSAGRRGIKKERECNHI